MYPTRMILSVLDMTKRGFTAKEIIREHKNRYTNVPVRMTISHWRLGRIPNSNLKELSVKENIEDYNKVLEYFDWRDTHNKQTYRKLCDKIQSAIHELKSEGETEITVHMIFEKMDKRFHMRASISGFVAKNYAILNLKRLDMRVIPANTLNQQTTVRIYEIIDTQKEIEGGN